MVGTSLEIYVAYLFVHCFAILSCSVLFVKYCVAMLPTRGSAENMKERTMGKMNRNKNTNQTHSVLFFNKASLIESMGE